MVKTLTADLVGTIAAGLAVVDSLSSFAPFSTRLGGGRIDAEGVASGLMSLSMGRLSGLLGIGSSMLSFELSGKGIIGGGMALHGDLLSARMDSK